MVNYDFGREWELSEIAKPAGNGACARETFQQKDQSISS